MCVWFCLFFLFFIFLFVKYLWVTYWFFFIQILLLIWEEKKKSPGGKPKTIKETNKQKKAKKKNPNLSITGRRLSREMPSFVLFPPFEMKIWLSVPSHQRCLQDLLHCWLKRKYVWFAALHSLIQLGQCPVNASENGAPSTSVCG